MSLSSERQSLLNQKRNVYVESMELPDSVINYDSIYTDRLLVLEAINDWSGHALAEGGEIRLTYGCDDPCCSTIEECARLARLMHETPVILYPVSGFTLTEKDELKFGLTSSTFRMVPHTSKSRLDGIRIAESIRIRDSDLAMHLWVTSATETCMAYLFEQMEIHNLFLEDGESQAVRSIVTSALRDRFSCGQIWNAMWRSVKDAAALSTRQYFNSTKAAKRIPKKIDSVLTQAASMSSFDSYERIASNPMGAVQTLFLNRFGIDDNSTGNEVRAKLVADAALAPKDEIEGFDEDHGLVVGKFYFQQELTALDQMILSCFDGIELESPEPQWDVKNTGVSQINFTLNSIYDFDGRVFGEKLLPMLGAKVPSEDDILRHSIIATEDKDNEFIDKSGLRQAFDEALLKIGIAPRLASSIYGVVRYPADLGDIFHLTRQLPLPTSLVAIRQDYAHVYSGFVEQSSHLFVGDLRLEIPEVNFEPIGDDMTIITAISEEDDNLLASIMSTGLFSSVSCNDAVKRARLIRLVAQKMIEEADQLLVGEG